MCEGVSLWPCLLEFFHHAHACRFSGSPKAPSTGRYLGLRVDPFGNDTITGTRLLSTINPNKLTSES